MFERMDGLGELIITLKYLIKELFRFLLTFGLFIILFLDTFWTLKKEIIIEELTPLKLMERLLDAFIGRARFEDYT